MQVFQYVCGSVILMGFGGFLVALGHSMAMKQMEQSSAMDQLVGEFREENITPPR